MVSIKKSVVINAPVARVYDHLTDPSHLTEIWPSMHKVENVRTQPDGAHSFDWTYRMAGVPFHGHAETREAQPNRRRVVHNEGGIPSTFTWTYQDQGPDRMELTVEIEYEIPGGLLQKLAEPFIRRINEREADTLLANLKERMESEAEAFVPPPTETPTEIRP